MSERKRPRRTLTLTEAERQELQRIRDREVRAYLREKAAALLKIADGQTPRQVALHGLLKPRDEDTVYGWLNAYQQTRKLPVRPACRGRFPPQSPGGAPGSGASVAPALRAPT